MIPISEAIRIIKRETFSLPAETIELENSIGRVLAENIKADMNLPPFDRAQMDGFAVRTEDTKNAPAHLRIIGESVAGNGFDRKLNSVEAVRIMTGARIPIGANAVQQVELTRENYGFVEILEPPKLLQNINKCGSEIKKGKKIFAKGEIITEQMVAGIASFGYAKLKVFQQPSIKILSTGSEIVEINEIPKKDQIRNSNSIMLKFFAEKTGGTAGILPKVSDDLETLKNQIAEAVGIGAQVPISKFRINKSRPRNAKPEIVIITGGVSVGDYDFTKPALRELGAEFFFEKLSLKPGKPTVFAKLNDVLIFALPGNPVSVAVTYYLFVHRTIMQMQSAAITDLKDGFAIVSDKIKGAKERDSYLPVSLLTTKTGSLMIESLRFSGSSNFIAFARANALVFVPQNRTLERGDVAQILFLP
ncbi:molybdopterin molybdotransferase MoeA [soil metagenome]